MKLIPRVSIAAAVIGITFHFSKFFKERMPYDTLNWEVVLAVILQTVWRIVVPILAVYIILTFINSGPKKIKQDYLEKIYDIAIPLLVSIILFTLGVTLLIIIAMAYPSIVGWFSNLIIYLMIGFMAVYLEIGFSKKPRIKEATVSALWILGIFYSLTLPNKIVFWVFIVITVVALIKIIFFGKDGR